MRAADCSLWDGGQTPQLGVTVRDAGGVDASPDGTLVVPRLQAMSRAYGEPLSRDFSSGPVAETPQSQYRGPGFDSCSIPSWS